jgi:hypothetical protein
VPRRAFERAVDEGLFAHVPENAVFTVRSDLDDMRVLSWIYDPAIRMFTGRSIPVLPGDQACGSGRPVLIVNYLSRAHEFHLEPLPCAK